MLFLTFALPLFWFRVQQLSYMSGIENFWIGLRFQTSRSAAEEGFGIYSYVLSFSIIMAIVAIYQNRRDFLGRIQTGYFVFLSLIYNVLTISRLGAILLIFSAIGIVSIRKGRISLRSIIIFAVIFVLIFSVPAILLNKGGSVENTTTENLSGIIKSLRTYSLASLVAFDQFVQAPDEVEGDWLSLRFFSAIGRAMGFDVNVPSLVLDDALTPEPVNVFTVFFSYYKDFNWYGALLFMFFLGCLSTWVFLSALRGNPQAAVIYAFIFASLLLVNASDPFMAALSFWIQALFYTTLIYRLPFLVKRTKPSDIDQTISTVSPAQS